MSDEYRASDSAKFSRDEMRDRVRDAVETYRAKIKECKDAASKAHCDLTDIMLEAEDWIASRHGKEPGETDFLTWPEEVVFPNDSFDCASEFDELSATAEEVEAARKCEEMEES